MKVVKVGNRLVGGDNPCFIILELGINFKDMQEAKCLVDAAIDVGADAIKFQTFHAKRVAMKGAILYDGRGEVDQYDELISSEDRLTDKFQTELIRYARGKDIIAFSTPSHKKDIDLLNKIGRVSAFKFGSDDLTNIPLLKYAAKFKKPIFLSTGVSTLAEIDEAISAIRSEGNQQVLLLHCVSQYPAETKDMNLRTMQTLYQAFNAPVGLSDHTKGIAISIAAAALGAKIIEKHFTLDRSAKGPDNFFSMEPEPMRQIIEGIRETESALGVFFKEVRKSEIPMVKNFHKSIFALRNIGVGESITEKNVDILRPLTGIPAKYYQIVRGMRPTKRIPKGQALQWEDFK